MTLLATGSAALATSIAPSYDTFGSFPTATFGGTGISTDNVAVSTGTQQDDTITLALTSTSRYFNPPLSNDGHGTFFATPGENDGLDSTPHPIGTTWSLNYYIGLDNKSLGLYSFDLVYGNNTTGAFQTFHMTPTGVNTSGVNQDTWNLDMSFLGGIGFDPNANGVYAFELEALNAQGVVVASTAINVDVGGHVPDTASTALLLGCGVLGLAAFRRQALAK